MIGLVAGFGRCGSSLVMAMLSAGGLPVVGFPPIYESSEFGTHFTSETLLRRNAGSIFKWLDPTHTYLPPAFRGGPVLWLDRNPADWAESHMKLHNLWHGSPLRSDDPATHAALCSEVQDRTRSAVAKIAGYGPVKRMRFEDILANPAGSAETLADLFRGFGRLSIGRAAAVVRARDAACAPAMEFDQASALASISRTHLGPQA